MSKECSNNLHICTCYILSIGLGYLLLIEFPRIIPVVSLNGWSLSYLLTIFPRVFPILSWYVHSIALYVRKEIWTLSQHSRYVLEIQHHWILNMFLWYPLIYTLPSTINQKSYNTKWGNIYGLPRNTWDSDEVTNILVVYIL